MPASNPIDTTLDQRVVYSADDRNFTEYDTLLRALENENHLFVGQVIYACMKTKGSDHAHISAESVLAHADFSESEESRDPFRSESAKVSVEAKKDLQDLLDAWAQKHIRGKYYAFEGESHEMELSEPLIVEFYGRAGISKVPSRFAPEQARSSAVH